MKKIVFPNSEGGISIIHSTGVIPVEEVARKDVPAGLPFKFIDAAQIPADRTFRNAWEADFSQPDGYGIGADAWFAEQEAKKNPPPIIDVIPEPTPIEPIPEPIPEPTPEPTPVESQPELIPEPTPGEEVTP